MYALGIHICIKNKYNASHIVANDAVKHQRALYFDLSNLTLMDFYFIIFTFAYCQRAANDLDFFLFDICIFKMSCVRVCAQTLESRDRIAFADMMVLTRHGLWYTHRRFTNL